jgi:acid phosphatase type 7
MVQRKSTLKYTLAVFIAAAVVLGLGLLAYAYFSQPQQTGQTTEPVASKRVVAAGDIVCSPSTTRTSTTCQDAATATEAAKLNPDAVLLLGDLQYDSGKLANFNSTFNETWGKLKGISYPAPGNHEYATTGAVGYYDYFGDRAGDRTKGYYSFNLGAWHIISLNSNCSKIDGCDESSLQGQWLKADLQNNTATCTLAFWHHPAATSGRYFGSSELDAGKALWQQVEDKVDVVLNGHDHLYERFAPNNGTTQFTVGTGGRSSYGETATAPLSQKIIENTFGVLVLNLNAETYNWQFIDTEGSVLDEGSQDCVN